MSEMAAALFVMFDKQIENSKKKTLSPEELDSEIDKFLKNFPFENLSEDDKEAFCRLARNKITVSIEPGVTLVAFIRCQTNRSSVIFSVFSDTIFKLFSFFT